jgi:predicted Zn-dependent protease
MFKAFRRLYCLRLYRLRWKQGVLFWLSALLVAGTAFRAISTEPTDQLQSAISKPHDLPQTLAQWNEAKTVGDYFDQVRPVKVGALVWSNLPIRVYIEPAPTGTLMKPEVWQTAISQAVKEWQPYLSLKLVNAASEADIRVSASSPPQKHGARVRSAETSYELYVGEHQTLAHRVAVRIRPSQTSQYLTAAARHELGHALGIWGHSLNPTDVMYFAQVRTPPGISARDINTLKRVYLQPTKLGWPVSKTGS